MMTTKKNWYLTQFVIFDQQYNGRKNTLAHSIRERAREVFRQTDFPDANHEAWRYSNLTPLMQYNFVPAANDEATQNINPIVQPYLQVSPHRLVFVNSHWNEDFSDTRKLPKKAIFKCLRDALRTHPDLIGKYLGSQSLSGNDIFSSLNLSLLNDGALIYLPNGIELEEPLHLLFISACGGRQFIHQPVVLVIAENNTRADVIVHTIGQPGEIYLTNLLAEVYAEPSSAIQVAHLQYEGHQSFHLYTLHAGVDEQAQFVHHAMALGSGFNRNNLFTRLNGENAEAVLHGLFIIDGQQHSDHSTFIDHAKPNCRSREIYKGILNGRSTGAFTGKILVRPQSQQTDAKQSSHNLILSRDATMYTRPQLEIFADDVKCTHGAAIGRIDEQALYYLRSRGINLYKAQTMLTIAFAQQLIDALPWPVVREEIEQKTLSLIRF